MILLPRMGQQKRKMFIAEFNEILPCATLASKQLSEENPM